MKLKKSLGQNFLKNENISKSIVNNIINCKSKNILEIGCGDGALTKYIDQLKFEKFFIVEFDEFWAKKAHEKFKSANVFCEDILKFNFPKNETWILIGNIPYNITFKIFQKIILWKNNLEKIIIMTQEEVAKKIIKNHGKDYGPISVLMQLLFEIELLEKIGPENFFPEPKIFSRIISLKPKPEIIFEEKQKDDFKKFLEIIFKFPRKKIKNNILGTTYKNIDEKFHDKRAQELSSEEIFNLWKNYKI